MQKTCRLIAKGFTVIIIIIIIIPSAWQSHGSQTVYPRTIGIRFGER